MLSHRTKTVVIVPCYNESSRLPKEEFAGFIDRFPEILFCFVNDGSRDNTGEILDNLRQDHRDQIAVINLKSNMGKAEAVRSGVNQVLLGQKPEFVGYWDADLSTPLEEIPKFAEILGRSPDIQMVCGSRVRRMGAVIKRTASRHYLGRIFATIAALILHLPIYDTQCGAKLIKAELAQSVFSAPFISKWFFDVEVFARTILVLGYEKSNRAILEIPLQKWVDEGGSKVKFRHLLKVPWELFRIFLAYDTKLKGSDRNVLESDKNTV